MWSATCAHSDGMSSIDIFSGSEEGLWRNSESVRRLYIGFALESVRRLLKGFAPRFVDAMALIINVDVRGWMHERTFALVLRGCTDFLEAGDVSALAPYKQARLPIFR